MFIKLYSVGDMWMNEYGTWWNYTYIGKEECSQITRPQCHFLHRKSHMDWLGLNPAPPRWVAPSHGTSWKDLRSIRTCGIEEIWWGCCCVWQGVYGKKETTFFKVASEFSAFMEPIGHSRIQSSPLRVPNQPCFIDQNSSLRFTCVYSR